MNITKITIIVLTIVGITMSLTSFALAGKISLTEEPYYDWTSPYDWKIATRTVVTYPYLLSGIAFCCFGLSLIAIAALLSRTYLT